jgi:hypothetical protein
MLVRMAGAHDLHYRMIVAQKRKLRTSMNHLVHLLDYEDKSRFIFSSITFILNRMFGCPRRWPPFPRLDSDALWTVAFVRRKGSDSCECSEDGE